MLEAINYTVKNTKTFSYPYSSNFLGMMYLHDYIMFFLLIISVFCIIFLLFVLLHSKEIVNYSVMTDRIRPTFLQQLYVNYDYLLEPIQISLPRRRGFKFFYNRYFVSEHHKFSHAPILELVWTLIPAFILASMAVPSFMLLYSIDEMHQPLYTIVVIGNQWYWTYEYSDFSVLNFSKDSRISVLLTMIGYEDLKLTYDSIILTDDQLPLGYPRLLAVDQPLVLPMATHIRILVTSNDVIHSWALPSYGIKVDAIPGRLNQISFYAPFFGTSWGQCSELCGINHAFMPIEIRTLRLPDFRCFIELNMLIKYELFTKILMQINDSMIVKEIVTPVLKSKKK